MHKFICNLKIYVCVFIYKMFIYVFSMNGTKNFTQKAPLTPYCKGALSLRQLSKWNVLAFYTRSDK